MYLCEAHASNLWPLSPAAPPSHPSLPARLTKAKTFLEEWPEFQDLLHCYYVDRMDNATTLEFGLWPERFLLLKDGVVAWANEQTEDIHDSIKAQLLTAADRIFK